MIYLDNKHGNVTICMHYMWPIRDLTWHERFGALVVDAWAWWTLQLMHRYQESLVGGPLCFGDLEIVHMIW